MKVTNISLVALVTSCIILLIAFSSVEAARPAGLSFPSRALLDTTYQVVAGDTGDSIAAKFGITFDQLENANPGVDWNNLQIGQTLDIPSGDGGSPSPPGPPAPDSPAQSYSGPASNFPDQSTWQSFDLLWSRNSQYMRDNTQDTDDQINWIQDSINQVSGESSPQIDNRVILCVIMQESSGNVYVQTTISPGAGVSNAGLMQSHNGVSFDPNNQQGSILQMIRDGTEGTASGDGYTQLLSQYGNIYEAMRGYNSGSVDTSNLSNGLGATDSYVSDIANRLLAAQGF